LREKCKERDGNKENRKERIMIEGE